MKNLLLLTLLTISACKKLTKRISDKAIIQDSLPGNIKTTEVNKTKFYIRQDSLIIKTENQDTLKYSREVFNEIVDNFPALYSNHPDDPASTFRCNSQFKEVIDKNGNRKHISFSSEVGQSEYYILYAYFLRKQFNLAKYNTRRQKLIKIYNNINAIYSKLHFGGTYFGHQYSRIIGDAEYGLYLYSINPDYYDKDYDVKKQNHFYINSLRQYIRDELKDERQFNQGVISLENKKQLEKDLNKLIAEIGGLITDRFYLKNAQRLEHAHY